MKAYRFRLYPSKRQERQLMQHLWLAKNLWNDLLGHSKELYKNFGKFPTQGSLEIMAKNSGLFSQTAQKIAHGLEDGIWRYVKLRKAGKKAGFPRFKSIDRMKSLHYPQFGFFLGNNLEVTPFGKIKIVQHRAIKGRIKTLAIKREASGKWFACFAVEETPTVKAPNGKPRIGIDLGLKALATFSDANIIENPRHLQEHAEKLAKLQRELAKKKKGSNNRRKAKKLAAVEYERLKNARGDFLHKETTKLVNSYSFIALEDLASQELAEKNHGKQINDAAWGELANMLRYKAEEAGCEVVFVNPKDTTKMCRMCGSTQDMPLDVRIYNCHACGHCEDRDLNAAHNILDRATAGTAGSNACRDLPPIRPAMDGQGISRKQDATGFSPW